MIEPIERDEDYERDYIPLPGGWEIQTKGRGSTFRICKITDERGLGVPEFPYLHETLTQMARDVHAAVKYNEEVIEQRNAMLTQVRAERDAAMADADDAARYRWLKSGNCHPGYTQSGPIHWGLLCSRTQVNSWEEIDAAIDQARAQVKP